MKSSRISDEAVVGATGKSWKEWFNILDKAGARKMQHRDIARFLSENYFSKPHNTNVATSSGWPASNALRSNAGWWSQMVTVEYERERGLRKVNQQADGFLVAVSKTVPGTVSSLQKKWQEILASKAVLEKKLVHIPSKTKRAMIRYNADVGRVVVSFLDQGKGKAQIIVESVKLPNKRTVEPVRAFWKKVLDDAFE